ncbi:MAG: type II toxin-antitoxin system VapC family toxin [Anaerolineae bacterium]
MVIDASVMLRGFFPDEEGRAAAQSVIRAYVQGDISLLAPTLLPYEVTNAVLQAIRRGRLSLAQSQEILRTFQDLGIPTVEVSWQRVLELAYRYNCSAYDGAYLALAEERSTPLVTGDRRLYNAVHDHLPWVLLLEDVTFGER